jgi:hypothetical protein
MKTLAQIQEHISKMEMNQDQIAMTYIAAMVQRFDDIKKNMRFDVWGKKYYSFTPSLEVLEVKLKRLIEEKDTQILEFYREFEKVFDSNRYKEYSIKKKNECIFFATQRF